MQENNQDTQAPVQETLDEVTAAVEESKAANVPAVDPVPDTPANSETPPAVPAQPNEDAEFGKVERTQPNVEECFDTEIRTSAGSPDKINLPPENSKAVYAALMNVANVDFTSTDNQFRWKTVLTDGLSYLPLSSTLSDRLSEKGAKFSQAISYNGHKLHAVIPTRKKKAGVVEMEGEMALLQVVTHLGIGGLATTPLYNSGFWVRFKPAGDAEMLELNIILSSDKVHFGRESYGLTHSNHIVYSLDRVLTMALNHVYSTSVKASEMSVDRIRQYLAPQDIHAFIWGFLCACYPNGFEYETACISSPSKCQHVFSGKIAVSKLLVSDDNALTDVQKNHMLKNSTNSMSLEDVLSYQKSITRMHEKRIIIGEGTSNEMAITLKTPSVPEYIEQGMQYVNGIVNAITRALSADSSEKERNQFIRTAANASLLCQYIHFVKAIEIGDISTGEGGIVKISDNDTIMKTLQTLSGVDSIRTKIIEEILGYIANSTISIVAIPAYSCPVCGEDQAKDTAESYPRHRAYVPVDIFQVFFGLFARRMNRVAER